MQNIGGQFEPFECLLEKNSRTDDRDIYKIQRGMRLSIKSIKMPDGAFRLQVWNMATPVGFIPDAYTNIICAAVNDYDVICLAAGTMLLKEGRGAGLLVRVDFAPLPEEVKNEIVLPTEPPPPDDSIFEFKMDESAAPEKVFAPLGEDFEVKTQKWYKLPVVMVAACFVFLPVGLFLLWKYGRQTVRSKIFFSVVMTLAVIGLFTGLKYASKGITKAIVGDSYKKTATDFMLAWQENDWQKMYDLSERRWHKKNSAYDIEQYFSDFSKVDSFDITEFYTDNDNNLVCVCVVYLDSVRYRSKILMKRSYFKYYVDVADLYDYLQRYSETIIKLPERDDNLIGYVYCYADGKSMIYHYDKHCPAAGDSLVRMPERDAIANGCGPCGHCAR
ncbi:MAG: hypothetical protein IJL87_10725 [Clostridia bacterium]|nr:hypothetical protein [Clostridia bacterium]